MVEQLDPKSVDQRVSIKLALSLVLCYGSQNLVIDFSMFILGASDERRMQKVCLINFKWGNSNRMRTDSWSKKELYVWKCGSEQGEV